MTVILDQFLQTLRESGLMPAQELDAFLGSLGVVLKVRTKDGTLVVTVNQPDAEVSVDDGKVTIKSPGDNQPVQVQVAEGKHTLRVAKGGFETLTKEFTIRSGGKETLRVELLRKPPAPGASETTRPAGASDTKPRAVVAPPATPSVDPDRRAAENRGDPVGFRCAFRYFTPARDSMLFGFRVARTLIP